MLKRFLAGVGDVLINIVGNLIVSRGARAATLQLVVMGALLFAVVPTAWSISGMTPAKMWQGVTGTASMAWRVIQGKPLFPVKAPRDGG